jgi:hypothetical protein
MEIKDYGEFLQPSSTAYRIKGGDVSSIALSAEGWSVPELEGEQPTRLLPGTEHKLQTSHIIPYLAEIAGRITPWAVWYITPDFTPRDPAYSGFAFWDQHVSVMMACTPTHAISLALHEAWHLCEQFIDPEALVALEDKLCASGPEWAGDYMPNRSERTARAFEGFACSLFEGVSLEISTPETRLFWHVYSGELGRQIMQQMQPVPERTGALRRVLSAVTGGAR